MLLKPFVIAILVLVVAPAATRAQDIKAEIIANETKAWQSFVGAHPDTASFANSVTPDYLCIEPNGTLMTKEQNVDKLNQLTFSSFRIEDPQVRILSPSAALIVARVHFVGTADGHSMAGVTLTSTLWVKRGNRWLSQLHTETFAK